MEDDFTGRAQLSNLAPDDSTVISFGVDEMVKVSRELKKSKVVPEGLFKKIRNTNCCTKTLLRTFGRKR